MITPYFYVDQDEEYLYVSVKVSNIRFSAPSTEMAVEGDLFVFSLPPYYLRLRLPFLVVDDERAKAEFDLKNNSVNIKLPKEIKGQYFPDLDLTAKLLARKDDFFHDISKRPLIEELDVANTLASETKGNAIEDIANEGQTHEWEISQEVDPGTSTRDSAYGFNNSYRKIIGVSLASGNDINELSDPESSVAPDRIMERLIKENIKFDPEYYAADFIMEKFPSKDDDKIYSGVMSWRSPTTRQFLTWYKTQQPLPEGEREVFVDMEFSEEDHERMLLLPKKSYLIDNTYKPQLWILLISLLFAHQFDLRENEGEHNIESAWTIGKLTPQFACLDSQIVVSNEPRTDILEAAIITITRRSLCYPFYRHYALTKKTWNDVYYILRSGKRVVLKCLLDLRELYRYHEVYYVYDKIWIEDLCLWILSDQVSENSLRHLAHDVRRKFDAIQKADVTFEKVDNTQNADTMRVFSIEDIEHLATESYNAFAK